MPPAEAPIATTVVLLSRTGGAICAFAALCRLLLPRVFCFMNSPGCLLARDFSPFTCLVLSSLRAQGNVACRSEEHTSELQSLTNLVCRLLLEKKKKNR